MCYYLNMKRLNPSILTRHILDGPSQLENITRDGEKLTNKFKEMAKLTL